MNISISPLGALLDLGGKVLDRVFPDPTERAKAELELAKLQQNGELAVISRQLEVNIAEAQHPSIFVSGARPFILWTCGVGFAWASIIQPLVTWYSAANGLALPPSVDADVLMYVLGGLLGLGGFRSYEKTKGVATR